MTRRSAARSPDRFSLLSSLLHWLMAVLIIAMLFIGIGMVSTVSELRSWLIDLHRPLGILILCLVAVRLVARLTVPPPPLPQDLPRWQRLVAQGSHLLLYALMIGQPLVGWAMLSAGGYPVTLFGSFDLPSITPVNPGLYAVLRQAHGLLALLLFATILGHLAAALYHAWIRRDGVFAAMLPWRGRG